MHVVCQGSEEGQQFLKSYRVPKSDITLGNLTTIKSRLGYGSRDYMYYKERSAADPAAATLKDIDYDVDALRMIDNNEEEREIRIVLSKNELADRCVAITPMKSNSNVCSDPEEEEEVYESDLNAYKDWLRLMHRRQQAMGEIYMMQPNTYMVFSMHLCLILSFLSRASRYLQGGHNKDIRRMVRC